MPALGAPFQSGYRLGFWVCGGYRLPRLSGPSSVHRLGTHCLQQIDYLVDTHLPSGNTLHCRLLPNSVDRSLQRDHASLRLYADVLSLEDSILKESCVNAVDDGTVVGFASLRVKTAAF